MLTLFRKQGVLHALCKVNLKKPVTFKAKVYDHSLFGREVLIEADAVTAILTENGYIRIFNGEKFVKFGLGEYTDILLKKSYLIADIEEKDVNNKKPNIEPKKNEVEEDILESIEEETTADESCDDEQKENMNDIKKKRHKNNGGGR